MARSPKKFKRYAWDSCSWIAGIGREVVQVNGVEENRGQLCRAVISDAEQGAVEILSSALVLAEVSKHPDDKADPTAAYANLKSYFENDYIVIVPLDRKVGELARDLMRAGHAGLKPLDATHIASALIANADELHTFDDKLINLDEKLTKRDGAKLKICKPSMGGPPLPLLDNKQDETDEELSAEPEDEDADADASDRAVPPDSGGVELQSNGGGLRRQTEGTDGKAGSAQQAPEAPNVSGAPAPPNAEAPSQT